MGSYSHATSVVVEDLGGDPLARVGEAGCIERSWLLVGRGPGGVGVRRHSLRQVLERARAATVCSSRLFRSSVSPESSVSVSVSFCRDSGVLWRNAGIRICENSAASRSAKVSYIRRCRGSTP